MPTNIEWTESTWNPVTGCTKISDGCHHCYADWARNIRDQCQEGNVPFFCKQWGGVNKKAAGKVLDGREWMEYPRERNGI